jgi:RNA polymerase sigma-70 factor (ECF subfamily)
MPRELRATSERDLLDRVRRGDARAFETIFRQYYEQLCRQIAAYLGDRDAVEDVVQSVLARLWRDRQTLDMPDDLAAWLSAAVKRGAIDQLRREEVRRRAAPLLSLEAEMPARSPIETFEADSLRHRFARAIAALPPRTREAFLLSRRDGLPYDQIALRMGISIKTVGVHIGKSLTVLRKVLGTK